MTSTPPIDSALSADDQLRARVAGVRVYSDGVPDLLVRVSSEVLAEAAASLARALASVEAARAAVVLEAESRGVISSSDHPKVAAWVEQSCRDGGVPVRAGQARQLHAVAATCKGFDMAGLRAAVTAGRVSMDSAVAVAKVFRRLRRMTDCPDWDGLLETFIAAAGDGCSTEDLVALEDATIGRFGREGALDLDHARLYAQRELTRFYRDRHGRMAATIRLDPASEAMFSAAIAALSTPLRDKNGNVPGPLDTRSVGARRVDALLAMVARATVPDKGLPGSGSKARVVVTLSHDTLMSGLAKIWGSSKTKNVGGSGHDGANGHKDGSGQADNNGHNDGSGHGGGSGHDGANGNARKADGSGHNGGGHVGGSGHDGHGGGSGDVDCGGERGYASTAFNQALSPTEARILACDAQIIPAVLGSKGELLELGRGKRLITPGLMHALHLRDQGCTFPGCSLPPSWCDGHHLIFWALGGPTNLDNLALLCRHHHTEVHRRGHQSHLDKHPDPGEPAITWTRGDGTPIGNQPRHAYSF